LVTIGSELVVKIDDEDNHDLISEHSIQAFPTIRFFDGPTSKDFEELRTFENLEAFFLSNLNGVQKEMTATKLYKKRRLF